MTVRPNAVLTSWPELERLVVQGISKQKESCSKTLRYIWNWCRCGVYVRVAHGRVEAFVPFANPAFENRWNLRTLLPQRWQQWPDEAKLPNALPPERWWCNAGVLCTQMGSEVWSTALFPEFLDMLEASATRAPETEVEFFLNKRDFPNVRKDGADPYGATFFGQLENVVNPRALLPVLSCFVGDLFSDVAIPLAQNHAADGRPLWESQEAFELDWKGRQPKAIFRGTATGCGCTSALNPRLALLELVGPGTTDSAYFDVCLTGRNGRIRKHPEEKVLRSLPRARHQERANFLSLEEQRKRCRFAICIEGHSAAGRLSDLLQNGFLVFLVNTVVAPANEMFYTRLLKHGRDVVCCSLEELPGMVRHYATDPEAYRDAMKIAWNATRFHQKYLVPSALETYLAEVLVKLGSEQISRKTEDGSI